MNKLNKSLATLIEEYNPPLMGEKEGIKHSIHNGVLSLESPIDDCGFKGYLWITIPCKLSLQNVIDILEDEYTALNNDDTDLDHWGFSRDDFRLDISMPGIRLNRMIKKGILGMLSIQLVTCFR